MQKLLLVLSLVLTTPALASDPFLQLSDQSATPPQILKNLYESTNVPATFEDFDYAEDKQSTQRCIIASPRTSYLDEVHMGRVRHLLKGHPDRGPLFPPTEDTEVEALAFAMTHVGFKKESLQKDASHYFQNSTLSTTKTALVYEYKPLAYFLSIRKNGEYIVFSISQYALNDKVALFYGYCFRQ